jgi:hypothetical protein
LEVVYGGCRDVKFKLTNSKVFLLLAVAAIAILAWGVYMAMARDEDEDEDTDIAAPAAGGSPAGTKAGDGAAVVEVQNVGVGDSVDFVVRDAKGNIKK